MLHCKVEKKAEKLENFKTAIGSTAKSLSNSENIEISFGKQSVRSQKTTIRLPEIEQIDNKINFNQIRALADSKSLKFVLVALKLLNLMNLKVISLKNFTKLQNRLGMKN